MNKQKLYICIKYLRICKINASISMKKKKNCWIYLNNKIWILFLEFSEDFKNYFSGWILFYRVTKNLVKFRILKFNLDAPLPQVFLIQHKFLHLRILNWIYFTKNISFIKSNTWHLSRVSIFKIPSSSTFKIFFVSISRYFFFVKFLWQF